MCLGSSFISIFWRFTAPLQGQFEPFCALAMRMSPLSQRVEAMAVRNGLLVSHCSCWVFVSWPG